MSIFFFSGNSIQWKQSVVGGAISNSTGTTAFTESLSQSEWFHKRCTSYAFPPAEVNVASMVFFFSLSLFALWKILLSNRIPCQTYAYKWINCWLRFGWEKKTGGWKTERTLFTVNLFEIDHDDSGERKTNSTAMNFLLCIHTHTHTSPDVIKHVVRWDWAEASNNFFCVCAMQYSQSNWTPLDVVRLSASRSASGIIVTLWAWVCACHYAYKFGDAIISCYRW